MMISSLAWLLFAGLLSQSESAPSGLLVKSGKECKSKDVQISKSARFSVDECATAVKAIGGRFFILGTGPKAGWCYKENTASASCPEGWDNDHYNFYAMVESQSHTIKKQAQNSKSTPWSKYLASLAGKTSSGFNWQTACKKLGQSPSGYSSGMGSGKTTFHLTCDSNKIDVVCRGNPFSSCMSTYKPPAVASDSPPTGSYAKTVGNRGCTRFSAAETQVFLDIHNKMRCAVGAPPVVWDGALACQAQKTQDGIGTNGMHHSNSYGMRFPAGENLATGTSPLNAAWMWFTEYLQSTNYAGGRTGHYNAVVWKSVKKIGCGVGKSGKGIVRCHYAGGSKAAAPNMAGQYRNNLSPFYGSPSDFAKCGLTASQVKGKASLYKKWGILHPTGRMARNIKMYSVTDAIWSNASPTAFFSACAFMGAAAMVIIGVALRRSRSPAASQDDTELLAVEAAEGLE